LETGGTRVVLGEVGFRGVACEVPASFTEDGSPTLSPTALTVLQPLFSIEGIDRKLDVVRQAPLVWSRGSTRLEIVPGFYTGLANVLRRDHVTIDPLENVGYRYASQRPPASFAHLPKDLREDFMRYEFLGYAKKEFRDRAWPWSVTTDVHGRTQLRVRGTVAEGEGEDGRAFELRWVLGNAAEFIAVVVHDSSANEDLATLVDAVVGSLDFHPDRADRW